VPEDPYIRTALGRYFPQPLRARFATQIHAHPLRREIISTHVINSMINRVGPTFVHRLKVEIGAAAADVVRAYMATREVFGLVGLWRDIEALDNHIDDAVQAELIMESGRLVQRGTLWFLRHRLWLGDLQATLAHFSPGVAALAERLAEYVAPAYRAELDESIGRRVEQGVPEALARRVAALEELYSALDLVEIAAESGRDEATVARVYFALGGELDLHWLGRQISAMPADTRWQNLARGALRSDMSTLARTLAGEAIRLAPAGSELDTVLEAWHRRVAVALERYQHLLGEVRGAQSIDLAMVSVLLRELRDMA
jgi:glutamate dehydrogenase